MITVVSHDVFGDGIGCTVELNRLELEGQLLAGLLLLVNGGRSIRNHRVAIKLELARLEEHIGLNGLNPLLSVEIKLLATAELLAVAAALGDQTHAASDLRCIEVHMNGLALVATVVEFTRAHARPCVGSIFCGGSLVIVHEQLVPTNIAIGRSGIATVVAGIVGKALEGNLFTEFEVDVMGEIPYRYATLFVIGMPNRLVVVVNQVPGISLIGRLEFSLLGVRRNGPTLSGNRLLHGLDVVFLLGALDDELFAISARSQLGVSALIVNLERRQLFAGDREGTGDCIVANGDLLTIHIRECIPPPRCIHWDQQRRPSAATTRS